MHIVLKDVEMETEPFEHVVIDNFLDVPIAENILFELENENYDDWDKRYDTGEQVKWRSNWQNDSDVPFHTLELIKYLNSGEFLRWLSKTTGVEGLIPDPYLTGGGFNIIKRNGVLAVHADGNWHDLMQVHRRLNVILYLNRDWKDEWGGHFELWSNDNGKPGECVKKVRPDFNRLVVFKTDDFSFHGHPTPLECPDTRSRKSLILYYYTSTRPEEELASEEKHRALFHVQEK